MNVNLQDLDAIFNGASSILNTTQTVTNAVGSGLNEFRDIVNNSSRRNIGYGNDYGYNPQYQQYPPQQYQQQQYPYQYQQIPIQYGYAYAETTQYNPYNYANQMNNGNSGYAGFTDYEYGRSCGTTPSSYYGNIPKGPTGGAWG